MSHLLLLILSNAVQCTLYAVELAPLAIRILPPQFRLAIRILPQQICKHRALVDATF
jgi:hypothetical protein